MSDQVQGQPQESQATPLQPESPSARPSWLPREFKTPEEMVKSYTELRKKMSRGPLRVEMVSEAENDQSAHQPPTTSPQDTAAEPGHAVPGKHEAASVLKAAGLNLEEFNDEFLSHGELSPTSYDRLLNAGFPKAMVDSYIAGQRAIQERNLSTVFELAGGSRESYAQMVEWAKETLSPEEVAAYDRVMTAGDMGAIKGAVKGLRAQYLAANRPEPRQTIGGSRPAAGDVFRSNEEVIAAVRDPRYKTDPAYRRAYEEKLARSDVFGMGRQR